MIKVLEWENEVLIKEFPNVEKALEWIDKNCSYEWSEDGYYYFYKDKKIELY